MTNKRILIADDDENILYLLEHSVNEVKDLYKQFNMPFNYEIETMKTGTELNNKLEKFVNGANGDLGIILTDNTMSGMFGLDIIKKYSKLNNFKKVPMILISGSSTDRSIEEAKNSGAFNYIKKPFNLKDVSLIIVDALKYSETN